jgi:hypothetical protein
MFDPTLGGEITPPSFQSLYLRLKFGDTQLATGTGFLVRSHAAVGLITARHNLTGRHHETDAYLHQHGGVPDSVEIFHNGLSSSNELRLERVLDDGGQPLWVEHPQLGALCDVALLPLDNSVEVLLAPYTWQREYPDIAIRVAEPVSVVGFPMAQTAGGMLAIWCTGYIASEPTQDYAGQPKFLIDCRTRPGQSGSPVIAYRNGSFASQGGAINFGVGTVVRPLGVYTGRIHPDADIGVVWKWSIVEELMKEFDLIAARRLQDAVTRFGPDSAEFAAELKRLHLTMN